jgi:hypothetical protein
MASKRYINKDCAYCGQIGASSTQDHVIFRAAFPKRSLAQTPSVPACQSCNNEKSLLESYVGAALLAGSRHGDGDEYRREVVSRRIAKNRKIQAELGLFDDPIWMPVNGVWQKMHALRVDAKKVNALMAMILRGLFYHHFGRPVHKSRDPQVGMFQHDREHEFIALVGDSFPPHSKRHAANLGRETFGYEIIQSPFDPDFTICRMAWHGGIPLYGRGAPPQGISVWWGVTWPDEELLAAA